MPVKVNTLREIELLRGVERVLAKVHNELGKLVRPGISTYEIDRTGEAMLRNSGM